MYLYKEIEKKCEKKFNKVIIIRDGRLPDKSMSNENIDEYKRVLGIKTTIIECRKINNPPILARSNRKPIGGMNVCVGSENIRFANFYDGRMGGLPRTFKIVLPDGADSLGWGIDNYVSILCGLSYSPSLGSQPHLPGPIYWADGIAKTSDTNNQFRGHHV